MIKINKKPPLVKIAVLNAIMCCMVSHYALADDTFINNDTTVNTDTSNPTNPQTYTVENGTLTVGNSAILNNYDIYHTVIDGLNDSTTTIIGGAQITGGINAENTSHLNVGLTGNTPVIINGTLLLVENSTSTFDNVNLFRTLPTDPADYGSSIEIRDNASATFGPRTTIQNSEIDGLTMLDNSSVTLNGSTIRGAYSGVALQDQASLKSTDAKISGTLNGLLVLGEANANLSGGTITATTGGPVTGDPSIAGRYGQYGAAVDIISVGDTATGAKVNIANAQLTANNGSSAGISTQVYNQATANTSVLNSHILAAKYGVLADFDNAAYTSLVNFKYPSLPINPTAGVSNITLSGTDVKSGQDSIHVNANAKADITVANGSTFASGNNVLLGTDQNSTTNLTVDNSQVTGNINNGGATNVTLQNAAIWTGASSDVTNLTLGSGTQWNLTGNSTVAGNVANSGTISLAQGTTTAGNQLTIGGNYVGNNATLLFNTALEADASKTDKLVINGSASGTTNVSVTNAGGSGAKTIDGIPIIQVGGASAANAFIQSGRIVAGAYDYTLKQQGNNWVLSSLLTNPTPTPIPTPTPTPIPTPFVRVERPEAGSYIANIATANTMFQTRLHERLGETRYIDPITGQSEVTSLWLRQVGIHSNFKDSSGQLKTQSNTYVAQLGGDIAQWSTTDKDRWHLGLMAGYGNSKNTTESSISGNKSRGSLDGYSVGAYGTWFANDVDHTGAYVDTQLQYAWFKNHVNGDELSGESYNSKGLTASVESGYTIALGQSGLASNPTRYFIEPNVQATWMGVKADKLTESNGTDVSSKGNGNIQTRLGVRAFMNGHSSIETNKDRSFEPYVELNWLHNTKRFGTSMNGASLQQAGAVNVGEVKVGVEGKLVKAVQLWGSVGQQVGDQGYSNTEAMVGVKYSF